VDAVKAQMRQVQLIDECIDDSNRIVLTDVVVQALREENTLRPVLPFDESLHHCYVFPQDGPSRSNHHSTFSHSLG
jgi:hypothetical protein